MTLPIWILITTYSCCENILAHIGDPVNTAICHVPNLEQGRTTINSEMCITLLVTVSALRGGKTECATNVRGNDTCQTGL
ncbi:hypothetical protein Plhal304r1_c058g0145251 [Plasmopara halstedii]